MDHESDWDEGLDLVLFAIRDSKSESMGFSPFQLLYGREIRGPLKETGINNQNLNKSPIQYIKDLQVKLSKIRDFAQSHLSNCPEKIKILTIKNRVLDPSIHVIRFWYFCQTK